MGKEVIQYYCAYSKKHLKKDVIMNGYIEDVITIDGKELCLMYNHNGEYEIIDLERDCVRMPLFS
jgi:hypothetical protein